MKRRGPKTLREHNELLRSEGRYDELRAAQEARRRESDRKAAEWRKAEQPLLADLRRTGIEVQSAWDLVNTSRPYLEALPVLLEHLARPYPDRVREGIARALAVRDARFAWPALVRLYQQEPPGTDAKDGLAVALAAISDRSTLSDLIRLAADRQQGTSRVLLIRGLTRSRQPSARAALERLQDDPEVGEEARRRVAARRSR
jgi:hypothetical protein